VIAWINFIILLIATFLTGYLYINSVRPVALSQEIGDAAWRKSERYRRISIVTMSITVINYIIYYFYPLPLPLARTFSWSWAVSIIIGFVILIPATYLLIRGSKDAGEETLKPRPDHKMYGGIYQTMRHPQAAGESVTWLGGAFLLNSPFLVLYSLLWLPIYYLMCRAEEKDLLLRFGQEYGEYMQRVGFLWPKKRQE